MTGWMFLFMGMWYGDSIITSIGFFLVAFNLWSIRTQFMVSTTQYIRGMIPHHSMAVHMSKKLLENQDVVISDFVKNIIATQEKEINYMKSISAI